MKIKKISPYLLILLLAAILYLPFLGKQGFYKDDWYQIWAGSTQGSSTLIRMFSIDRPALGLLYAITHKVIGDSLFGWHLFAFIIRVCVSFMLYQITEKIFNDRKISLLVGVITVIYPGYLEQPFADTSSNLFLAYGICVSSIYLSTLAVMEERKALRFLLTTISVICGFCSLMIFEYFIGMEIVRIVIFYTLGRKKSNQKKRELFSESLKQAIPYILMVALFLFWRLFIFKSARNTTDIHQVIGLYLSNPFGMLTQTFANFFSGIYNAIFAAWTVPSYIVTTKISPVEIFISGVLSAAIACGFYYFIHSMKNEQNDPSITRNIFLIGIVMVVSVALPIILVNRKINFESTFTHYTFPIMFGAALAVVGLIYLFVQNEKMRSILISLLVATSVFTQFANGIYYSRFWDMQKSLWWQLSWRTPGINSDTTLVVFTPAAYRFAEAYEIWAPANIIYNHSEEPILISAEVPNEQTLPLMINQQTYGEELRRVPYVVDFKQMLALSAPHSGICLHVFDNEKNEISSHEENEVRLIYPFSNVNLIDTVKESEHLSTNIFGNEPEHTWCYYYQKASLARQKGDWQEIVDLGLQVLENNFKPVDVSEWMPFYEGFARGDRIDLANEVGALIRQDQNFIATYCGYQSENNIETRDEIGSYLIANLCVSVQ